MRTLVNHHLGKNKPFTFDHINDSPDCTGGIVLLKRLLFLDVIHSKLWTFIVTKTFWAFFSCVTFTTVTDTSALQNWHRQSLGVELNSFASGAWNLLLWSAGEHQGIPCLLRAREGHSSQNSCNSQSYLAGVMSTLFKYPKPGILYESSSYVHMKHTFWYISYRT